MESSTFKKCKKNPGHDKFICLPDLTTSKLPHGCQNDEFLSAVRWRGRRTVKIIVFHTSPSRSGKYVMKNVPRNGTGFIYRFSHRPRQTSDLVSPLTSPVTSDGELELRVSTAAHVVFDETEVKQTRLELFFDDDKDRSTVVRAEGVRLVGVDTETDDVTFIARLTRPEDTAHVISQISETTPTIPRSTPNVTFAVSHPHGVA